MQFNSVEFAVFFAVVLAVYWSVPHRARTVLLLVGSYGFYAAWDVRFCSLLLISTLVDFTTAKRMPTASIRGRRWLLGTSLAVNLGILATFKYLGFFVASFQSLVADTPLAPSSPLLSIVLPVGISFYTFQTMSYTIDVARGRLRPTDDLLTFAVYVAYFPQLVAGPIERATVLLPQLETPRVRITTEQVASGVGLIVLGLVRKVVLADGVAPMADALFDDPGSADVLTALTGIAAFSIQIYGDFAGYTDIARGVSRLLGIELSLNFAQPYLSRNITEFWRRWHISLSTWLREYLYIPLGGNRHGSARTYANLMLTMLLGGLWHGASWTFVVWGALHGLALAVHRAIGRPTPPTDRVRLVEVPRVLATALLVGSIWVFFRAETFGDAAEVFAALGRFDGVLVSWASMHVLVIGSVALAIDLVARRGGPAMVTVRSRPELIGALAAVAAVLIVVFSGGTPRPFVYFQF